MNNLKLLGCVLLSTLLSYNAFSSETYVDDLGQRYVNALGNMIDFVDYDIDGDDLDRMIFVYGSFAPMRYLFSISEGLKDHVVTYSLGLSQINNYFNHNGMMRAEILDVYGRVMGKINYLPENLYNNLCNLSSYYEMNVIPHLEDNSDILAIFESIDNVYERFVNNDEEHPVALDLFDPQVQYDAVEHAIDYTISFVNNIRNILLETYQNISNNTTQGNNPETTTEVNPENDPEEDFSDFVVVF